MEKIKSFTIDHDIHKKGFYLSGVANNIYTYDLRVKTPNGGDYMDNSAMHTIEHLFATMYEIPHKREMLFILDQWGVGQVFIC